MDAKIKVFVKKSIFERIKPRKYTKKSGSYAFILHNYPILVRSTGIAPLAARPAKRLSIVCFAFVKTVFFVS